MSTPPNTYTLTVSANVTSCTITLQEFSTGTLKISGQTVSSVTATQSANNVLFTVGGGEYINAIANAVYTAAPGTGPSPSQCNLCFVLASDSSFVWQATGTLAQGDNPTIFVPSTQTNQTEYVHPIITIQPATVANPPVPPSAANVLQPNQVFIVDWDLAKKNLLVRGNAPMGPATPNGSQTINFPNLQNAIASACTAASVSAPSDFGNYVLHDIALLSSAEEYIWGNEYMSYAGNTGSPNSTQETWFPSTPSLLPGFSGTGTSPTGQMGRWDVEPDLVGTKLVNLVTSLQNWMSTPQTTYHIYYFHCASGHDRTGMVAAAYLAQKALNGGTLAATAVDDGFICGTTLQKQTASGGDIVADCYDLNTTNVSSTKSRCFLASSDYNQTFLAGLTTLVPPAAGTVYALGDSTKRSSTGGSHPHDKPYVITGYPWLTAS